MKTIKIKYFNEMPANFTGIVEFSDGTKWWCLNGERHREEGPCTACKDCLKGNFVLCTKPGPAIIYPDGTKLWYLNGKQHREDGPAIIYPDGTKLWCLNGERHREDGPAVEYPNGTKEWFLNGKRHREDGPAVECPDGTKQWFLDGLFLSKKQYKHYSNIIKLGYSREVAQWLLKNMQISLK